MSLVELKLPDLGLGDLPIRVTGWLVDRGAAVLAGDPVVEVLCGNVTVDVPANISGRLFEKKVDVDAVARPGEVLGVIERY